MILEPKKIKSVTVSLFLPSILCLTLFSSMDYSHQVPLPMEYSSRQEYQSRVPFPIPGDLPNPVIELGSLASVGGFFLPLVPPGKAAKALQRPIYKTN